MSAGGRRVDPRWGSVRIGGIPVGDAHPVLLMAEIGTFFNQDMEMALEYVRRAAKAGVRVLKSELLHSAEVCLSGTGVECRYHHQGGEAVEDYRALVERKVVALSEYRRLFALCRELSMPVVCSVYDCEGVDFLVEEGGAAIKIARDNINNIGLIQYAAASGLPLLFDAGNVSMEELTRALESARSAGEGGVIVNLHPAANPAPPEAHNLRQARTLKERFGCPVGLACHYRGEEIILAAIGAGVNIIEKGVDADPDRREQDLVSAVSLEALPGLVERIEACSQAMGDGGFEVRRPRDETTWKCLVARRDIRRGEVLGYHNLGFAMPPLGISADQWERVADGVAARDIAGGTPLVWDDVE